MGKGGELVVPSLSSGFNSSFQQIHFWQEQTKVQKGNVLVVKEMHHSLFDNTRKRLPFVTVCGALRLASLYCA